MVEIPDKVLEKIKDALKPMARSADFIDQFRSHMTDGDAMFHHESGRSSAKVTVKNARDARAVLHLLQLTDLGGLFVPRPYQYNRDKPSYGTVMPVDEWKSYVEAGGFIDYDGYGSLMRDGKLADRVVIWPSQAYLLPADVTHIC
jgi:hypothetical protein